MNPFTIIENQFVGRGPQVRSIVECMIAAQTPNILCVGPPGTGKSKVVDCFIKTFKDVDTFHTVFTHMSKPADVFGPQSIEAFTDRGKLHYNTEGFATTCDLVRLEEGTKAMGPLQDMLLGFYEDRLFANGNTIEHAKTHTVFIDSNELPNETNGAMLDRFFVIFFPMLESKPHLFSFTKLYSGKHHDPVDSVNPVIPLDAIRKLNEAATSATILPETILTWNRIIQGISNNTKKGGNVVSASAESSFLRGSFQQFNDVTQRSQGNAMRLTKARACRKQRDYVLPHDLAAALPAMWSDHSYFSGIKDVLYSWALPTYSANSDRARHAKESADTCIENTTEYILDHGSNSSLPDNEKWEDVLNGLKDARVEITKSAEMAYEHNGKVEVPDEIQDIVQGLDEYTNHCNELRTIAVGIGV